MPKKQKKFTDDGWAIWIDGDDTSTVYINDWLNPKGKSYVDFAIRIRGVKSSKKMNVYVPFALCREEVEDVSLFFNDTKILQATFSAACIVDYKKISTRQKLHTMAKRWILCISALLTISFLPYQTALSSPLT